MLNNNFLRHGQTCDVVITDITSDRDYVADETGDANGDNLTWTVWLFFAAQLLHGAGASPLFTLGVTYIDENVSKKMSSVYLGKFYFCIHILAWAAGWWLISVSSEA